MMPGLSGFETCRLLKDNAKTADIPVIFMTALTETSEKVEGFSVGALDYITKPFQKEEVLARLAAHLRLRDLTRQLREANRQLEERARELEAANQAKDKFLSIIAHDLRGPFMPVLGFASQLVRRAATAPAEDVQRYADRIQRSAQAVHDLLENLLHWSRLQLGRFEPVMFEADLKSTVEGVLSIFAETAEGKGVRLGNDVPSGLTVHADENMLTAVLRNLVSNGLKFTPTGGQVTVAASLTPGSEVEVRVSDTGMGIPEENLPRLLANQVPFSTPGTAHERGTGLGLMICQEMVTKNGGRIWIESRKGAGTTVAFTLMPSDVGVQTVSESANQSS
jgi:signal transduction histidine kinase